MSVLKRYRVPVVALLGSSLAFAFSGCLADSSNSTTSASRSGGVKITVAVDKVGALGKTATTNDIVMNMLHLSAFAAGEAALHDSIPLTPGSGHYNVQRNFPELAAGKEWTVSAVARDAAGIVIYSADSSFTVLPKTTHVINFTLAARYSMLKARFFPIRDSVTRLELRVNGELEASSSFAKQSRLADTVVLDHDYLAASPAGIGHAIRLDARGNMWGSDTLLYRGDTTLTVVSGKDTTYNITLRWVGPSIPPPGAATMNVTLGALGTVLLNGELEDTTAIH